jgi:pimeloyl-ACP methyl ester carboxylesterase
MKKKKKTKRGNYSVDAMRYLKKTFLYALIVVFFALASAGVIYQFFPSVIESYSISRSLEQAEVKVKKLSVGDQEYCYLEGNGKGPTLLLIHGFQGDKKYWLGYIKRFKNYHVIALDLPGHGESSALDSQRFDIHSLAKNVEEFVKAKQLTDFHIVGTSMGGGVACCYCLSYPQKVKSLILINPLGVNPPKKSDLQLLLDQGRNLLLPENLKDIDDYGHMLLGKPFSLSLRFKQYLLDKMKSKREFFQRIFTDMVNSRMLEGSLGKLPVKTLILMSCKDRVLHISSFELFAKRIPRAQGVYLEEGTHVLIGSSFEKAILEMDKFLQERSL